MAAEKVPLVSSMIVKTWRHFMHDSLRRNSTLLIASQAINAGVGFIFWITCAHLFKTSQVGLATAFISFGVLVSTFTNLGLPNTIVRFLPTSKNRGGLFTGALYLVAGASIIGGIIAILIIKLVVPKLGFVQTSPFLSIMLLLLVACNTIGAFLDGTLMAFRKGQYILGKALVVNALRIALPFFVIELAMKGIVLTYVVVFILGIIYNLFTITRKLLRNQSYRPTMADAIKHRGYAAGNYFGGMLGILPGTLVPILIFSKLGSESAAYFYMPMQIATFLGIIASSTSQAMISEASQTSEVGLHSIYFRNALKHTYALLLPAVFLVLIVGWPILRIYGSEYAINGYPVLAVLAMASLLVAINWLGDTWLNVKKRSRAYFFMNGFNALFVVVAVYFFVSHGLRAAAMGWLIGQLVSALVYGVIFARSQLFQVAEWFRISA